MYDKKRLATIRLLEKVLQHNSEGKPFHSKDLNSSSQILLVSPLKEDSYLTSNGKGLEITEKGKSLLEELKRKKGRSLGAIKSLKETRENKTGVKKEGGYYIYVEGYDMKMELHYEGLRSNLLNIISQLEKK